MDYKKEYEQLQELLKDAEYQRETADGLFMMRLEEIIKQYQQGAPEQNKQAIKNELTSSAKTYKDAKIKYAHEESEEARNALNTTLNSLLNSYPELSQLDTYIEQYWVSDDNAKLYMQDLMNMKPLSDNLEPDATQQISNLQENIKQDINESVTNQKWDGHLYPVELVVSWTNQLKDLNKKLDEYIASLNAMHLENVDKTWLRNNIKEFVNWISKRLKTIRTKMVDGMKSMYKGANDAINTIAKLIPTSISLDTIVTWAGNVISVFTKPFEVVITFIKDFMTYTPPLIAEAGKVAGKVITTPSIVLNKLGELKGEGNEVVRQEIENAMKDVAFEPPSIGELQG